ncbi:MAG TPA: hypothetical protein VHR45_19120 [Thermoanaerobaculia bacterium]|nr:hypothetical protein [Thermoanaerobaculia bacterium]
MFINLAVLAGVGIIVSGWILYYTDWFPIVGGLLGLGGAFAWAAFLSGLLTGERKKELQDGFERCFLGSGLTWKISILVGMVFALCCSLYGSVVLDTSGDDHGRLISVIPANAPRAAGDQEYLVPHGEQKRVVLTGWLGRPYVVKVSGLPAAFPKVHPFGHTRLRLPADLWIRPVLLVRLAPTLGADAAQGLFSLTVKSDGKEIGRIASDRYRGESVWVGCDVDVAIPDRLLNQWRIELARMFRETPAVSRREEEVLGRWMAPLAVAEETPSRVGDKIEVTLAAADGHPVAVSKLRVRSSRGETNDVQEVYLKYAIPLEAQGGGDS